LRVFLAVHVVLPFVRQPFCQVGTSHSTLLMFLLSMTSLGGF
jgi:heme/copper-type cytochrome/quinol oxidase subunit 1